MDFARKMGTKAVSCTQPRRVAAMSVAQRVSEERVDAMKEEIFSSIAYLQVQLEKAKSARALLASTARKNQHVTLQEHNVELVAHETKHKAALADAINCAVKEVLTRAKVASDDQAMSLAEERAMLQEETQIEIYYAQLGFDEAIMQYEREYGFDVKTKWGAAVVNVSDIFYVDVFFLGRRPTLKELKSSPNGLGIVKNKF